MPAKKVIIIGGGIAGLCAGVYLRKSGFETEILEMHTDAGGLATGWNRNGYTFENCIHWLVGSKPGGDLNSIWREVFDIDQLQFHEGEEYERLEAEGKTLVIFRNTDRLEREFLEKAPEDAATIREFSSAVRKFSSVKMPGGERGLKALVALVKFSRYLPALRRYSKLTMEDFSRKFKNPLLREFFSGGLSEISFLAILFSLAWMNSGNAGYPIGGSLKLIGLIEKNYRSLGGNIRFGLRVKKIIVRDGRAIGVALESGDENEADIVVSAADGYSTIFEMLGGRFLSRKIKEAYETYKPFPSYVQVSLGVADSFKDEPGFLSISLAKPIDIDPGTRRKTLTLRIFNYDPTLAPAGKTAVIAFFTTDQYEFWVNLRANDRARYESEKKRVAGEVVNFLETRFPASKGKVEVIDVATPATVSRYTGNWKGSMEGWLPTPQTGFRSLPGVLPGLKEFYMVGQWVSPGGGLPSGLLGGRAVAAKICRDHGIRFQPKNPK
jgi:phytoene dehydrogenase-like protein